MKLPLILATLLALFFTITLGLRPYGTPSEARYIEIPRQMVATSDWVTPRLNGVKYFEKPPLFYWLQAAQFKAFGMGEFSGRFWTMALMLALCLATYGAGCALYGRLSGLFAAVALASSVMGFALSRIVLLDVPVSLFLTGTLFAFILAVRMPAGRARSWLLMGMYASAACAVLTKGLIGMVLPGLVIGVWMALTRNWQLLGQVKLLPGLLLFLVIATPWHVLAAQQTPEFLQFYFIHEHFQRYLTPEAHRVQPWWFFIAVLVAGWLPWTFFLPQALRGGLRGAWAERRVEGAPLFLGLWAGLLFLFFSASHSKLIPYILPVFPPLALWLGDYLAQIWVVTTQAEKPFRRSIMALVALLAAALVASAALRPLLLRKGLLTPVLAPYGLALLAWAALIAAVLLVMLKKRAPACQFIQIIGAYAVLQALLLDVAAAHFPRDSVKPMAEYLRNESAPEDEIAVFRHYYQDLPVYLHHNVTVAGIEDEMAFGISIEPATRAWMIDEGEFWRRWNMPGHRMAVVMRKSMLPLANPPAGSILQPVMETGNDVLLINRKDAP